MFVALGDPIQGALTLTPCNNECSVHKLPAFITSIYYPYRSNYFCTVPIVTEIGKNIIAVACSHGDAKEKTQYIKREREREGKQISGSAVV